MADLSLYQTTFLETCFDVAAFTLVSYEYLITLEREVDLVWRKRFTGATAMFLLNRYIALLKYPVLVAAFYPLSDKSCAAVNLLAAILEILPYFVWLSFLTLRIYAICSYDWRPTLLVVLTACVPLLSNIYLYSQTFTINYPLPIGCTWSTNMSTDLYQILLILTRTSVILSDVIVLGITWWKTYGVARAVREANIQGPSLAVLLLRDGTIYFLVMLTLNVFHIAFSLTNRFAYTVVMEEPIITVLISRFILNLREADTRSRIRGLNGRPLSSIQLQDEPSSSPSHPTTSFIAPFGAPLDHGLVPSEGEADGCSPTDRLECLTTKNHSELQLPSWDCEMLKDSVHAGSGCAQPMNYDPPAGQYIPAVDDAQDKHPGQPSAAEPSCITPRVSV